MSFKVAVICALIAVVTAGHHGYVQHEVHQPQPYHFGYDVKDHHGSQFRQESGDGHGGVKGSYGFTDHRGIHREVHYVADHNGFRAQVKTNEPGTANQDPAHVNVHSNAQYHHAPQVHHGGYGGGFGGAGGYIG